MKCKKKKKIADKCSSTKKNTGLILSIYIFLPPLMARRKNGVYFILQTTDRLSQMLEKPTNDYPLRKDMYRKDRLYRLCRPYRQLQESIKAIVSYYPNASFTKGNLSLWKITAGNQCQLSFECAILRKKWAIIYVLWFDFYRIRPTQQGFVILRMSGERSKFIFRITRLSGGTNFALMLLIAFDIVRWTVMY